MKILTFDIEDWFHLLDVPRTSNMSDWDAFRPHLRKNVGRLLDTIQHFKQPATFFCLGWIAERYPDVVKSIDALGYEVGSHSYSHGLTYTLTREQFYQDVDRSIKTLEDTIGKKVKSFRAPGFSIGHNMPWAFEVLIELGIKYDSSIFPARRSHGGFPEFPANSPALLRCGGSYLKEFPINIASIFGRKIIYSGGGYFRLLPYSLIKKFSNSSNYVMTYFHPRDFDTEQPKLNLSALRYFKSYYGLSSAHNKLELWLRDNKFIDIATANTEVDWKKAEIIDI